MGGRLFVRQVYWMIRKELLSILKDPRTRYILVMPVIMQSLLFGYVATYDLDMVPYALLDLSHSQKSREFAARLDGSPAFKRVRTLQNAEEIAPAIDSGEVIMAVTLPQDFARQLNTGGMAAVQGITDGRNSMTAMFASSYVNGITAEFNSSRNPRLNAVGLETSVWYNPNLMTRWSFMPALMAMLTLVQVLMLSGLSVAREREQGTFDQLLVTPLSPLQILIGKAVPPMLMGIFQATIVLLICRFWFQIPFAGDLLSLYLVIFVFMLSCTGIGLSISAISQSMQQVMVYCFVFLMPMILLSGLATPVENMPEFLQIVTYADPMRFALDSIRRIYLEGCNAFEVAGNFLPMLAVAAVTMPVAGYLFRNNLE